jgi:hypothetical protein
LPSRFAFGATGFPGQVASRAGLFSSLFSRRTSLHPGRLSRLAGYFTGMFSRLASYLAGFRTILPIAIIMYVRQSAARQEHRAQKHCAYRSRHTASSSWIKTNESSFCSENFG